MRDVNEERIGTSGSIVNPLTGGADADLLTSEAFAVDGNPNTVVLTPDRVRLDPHFTLSDVAGVAVVLTDGAQFAPTLNHTYRSVSEYYQPVPAD